jgi:hypothetical protein
MPRMFRRRVLGGGAAVLALTSPRTQDIPPQVTIVLRFVAAQGSGSSPTRRSTSCRQKTVQHRGR